MKLELERAWVEGEVDRLIQGRLSSPARYFPGDELRDCIADSLFEQESARADACDSEEGKKEILTHLRKTIGNREQGIGRTVGTHLGNTCANVPDYGWIPKEELTPAEAMLIQDRQAQDTMSKISKFRQDTDGRMEKYGREYVFNRLSKESMTLYSLGRSFLST